MTPSRESSVRAVGLTGRGRAVVALGGGVAVYVVSLVARAGQDFSTGWDVVFANLLLVGCTTLIAIFAARSSRDRRALQVLMAAVAMYTLGNIAYGLYAISGVEVPYPSWADVAYLGFPPLAVVALLLAVRTRSSGVRAPWITWTVALDGVLGAVAAAAVTSAVFGTVLGPEWLADTSGIQLAVTAAYPILDTILLSVAVGVMCLPRRPAGWFVPLIAIGAALFALADVIYSARILSDSYVFGSPLDALWMVGIYLCAVAAWRGPGAGTYSALPLVRIIVPIGAVGVGMVLLIVGNWASLSTPTVVLSAGCIVLGLLHGVLDMRRVQALADADRLARTDELTGLRNRRGFLQVLDVLLESVPREGRVMVVFIDVDEFKAINDHFGHSAGDAALRHLASALAACVRPQDIAARVGGDEFAVAGTLSGLDRDAAIGIGRDLSDRLALALASPVAGAPDGVRVRVSAGFAISPEDGTNADALVQRADRRMYRDKASHR